MIPVYQPYISRYTQRAVEALKEGWISNHGLYVELSTELLKTIFKVKHCILMNSGTAATESLILSLLRLHPELETIYIPNEVFVAPWSLAYKHYGSAKLTALATNRLTSNMVTDKEYLLSLKEKSAIICVHNLGSVVNVPRIKRIRPDIVMVEDNCEGLFGKYELSYTGSYAETLCSSCSFYGNKVITTGEGGAFFTNNDDIYEYIKKYHSHGMGRERYIHELAGHNFRMTNIQAALLYEQLVDIEHILSQKRRVFDTYSALLAPHSEQLRILDTDVDTERSHWMFSLVIAKGDYPSFEHFLLEHGIQVRPFFYDISKHAFLGNVERHPVAVPAENCIGFGAMLPSHPGLTPEQQKYIINIVTRYIGEITS